MARGGSGIGDDGDMRRAVLLIFVLSGAAGLVYEVVWARELVLVFGNTTQAVSAILTGFFAGMALGSAAGGRLADRVRSPLRLYGLLEIAIAAVALATPVLFSVVRASYREAYPLLENTPLALALVRFGLSLVALAPATVLMGATLPTLSRHLARAREDVSEAFGRLYAANTVGAIVGAAASGFVLIELLGLSGALVVGAGCSLVAGAVALMLARATPQRTVTVTTLAAGRERRLALVVAFVSGLTSLGYQVLWTRLLSSGTGNTTYVFTTILVLFLVGIAVGALLFSAGLGRGGRPTTWLGVCQLAVGAIALTGTVLIGGGIVDLSLEAAPLLTVLPATLVMGLALPIASGLVAQRDERIGTDTGLLLGANTLGIVIGTFVVPFVLVPAIGSPRSAACLAIVNLVLGAVLLGLRQQARAAIGPALVAASVVVLAVGSPLLIDPGAARIARGGGQLFASGEDEIASVQSGQIRNDLHLWVAGTSMTALTIDAKFMALLPVMVRPDARSALVIAFGMGSSYRAALEAGMTVVGVELVPTVPRMFRYYYSDADAVLENPRGRLVIADGRNHVELTHDRYDVVIVDPPPPIRSAGTAVLYSREFYAASAARLSDSGVMMEWMPYLQTMDEFRSHVRTFADVFPNLLIALGPGHSGVFMLGSRSAVALAPSAVRSVLARPGIGEDLSATPDAHGRAPGSWADLVPAMVWLAGDDARRFAGDAPPITDDRPLTEYFLLRDLFGRPSPQMTEAQLRAAAVIR